MKILHLYFILFSKLYIKFSKREDDWFYMPLLILTFLITLNILNISFLFFKPLFYLVVVISILVYILLILLFSSLKDKGKEFVKNYTLSNKVISLLVFLLIVDFVILFVPSNNIIEKNNPPNTEKSSRKIEIEQYNYE